MPYAVVLTTTGKKVPGFRCKGQINLIMLLIIRILALIFAIIGVLLSVCSIGYCIQDVFMEYSQGETTNGELDAPSHWKFWLKFFASFMSIFIHLAGLYGMKTRKPKFMWPWICAFAMASKVFVSLNYTLANLLYFQELEC